MGLNGLTPVGQLVVPDQVVASELLSILRCQVRDRISVRVAEDATRWLDAIPLLQRQGKVIVWQAA
jgi:hypothetical protein